MYTGNTEAGLMTIVPLTYCTCACLNGTIGKGVEEVELFLETIGITCNRYSGVNYFRDCTLFKDALLSKLVKLL